MLTFLAGQVNLTPHSSATAQTFGAFSKGLNAVNWNPATLAISSRDTLFHLFATNIDNEVQADSIKSWLQHILFTDSLYIKVKQKHR